MGSLLYGHCLWTSWPTAKELHLWRKQKHLCHSKVTHEIFEVHLTLKRPWWPGGFFCCWWSSWFCCFGSCILNVHFWWMDGGRLVLAIRKSDETREGGKTGKGPWELKQVSKTKDDTIPKTKITRKKLPSQKENNFPTTIFQGLCWTLGVYRCTYIVLICSVRKIRFPPSEGRTHNILSLRNLCSTVSVPGIQTWNKIWY